MSEYLHFTEEQKQAARNADLLDYVRRRGYEVVKHGNSEYMLKEHDSIKISNNLWCRYSQQTVDANGELSYEGGNTLDFAMKFEGLNFVEAMKAIGGQMNYGLPQYHYDYSKKKEEKDVILPEPNSDCKHVFAYLCKTRCIDEDVVRSLLKQKILYESREHHNCVFVANDENGTARYGFIRGTNSEKRFVQEAKYSTKSYGLVIPGKSDTVYVFEAIIDAMSHATMTKLDGGDWKKDTRISLGGISPLALNRLLSKNENIKNIVVCTDNDEVGNEAARNFMKVYDGKGYTVSRESPYEKDFNEDLVKSMHRSRSMARAI